MGVHTGDSITVAPAMTLTDREYQTMRDAAVAIIREIGVDAGGCNIQFAVNPQNGDLIVIEMNPRVSRSSALASKATGFPIARIGAKLAVGFRLDEVPNDITKTTPASFEPVLDYVVVKCPRFAFEKFATADPGLTTQMKSVGESMAIGRTFKEAFQKALRARQVVQDGWSASAFSMTASRSCRRSRFAARCVGPRRSGCFSSSAPWKWAWAPRNFTSSRASTRGFWSSFANCWMRKRSLPRWPKSSSTTCAA
jgi:carbamoylphosphate synthase large subunit